MKLIAMAKKAINTSTKKYQITKTDQIKLRQQLLKRLNKAKIKSNKYKTHKSLKDLGSHEKVVRDKK